MAEPVGIPASCCLQLLVVEAPLDGRWGHMVLVPPYERFKVGTVFTRLPSRRFAEAPFPRFRPSEQECEARGDQHQARYSSAQAQPAFRPVQNLKQKQCPYANAQQGQQQTDPS